MWCSQGGLRKTALTASFGWPCLSWHLRVSPLFYSKLHPMMTDKGGVCSQTSILHCRVHLRKIDCVIRRGSVIGKSIGKMLQDLASRSLSTLVSGTATGPWEGLIAICFVAFILYCFIRPLLPVVCLYIASLVVTRRIPKMSEIVDHIRALITELARCP